MENEGEEKSGEKGKENAGTKEEEEGKAAGKRGNGTGKVGATRLKTRTKKTQKKHKGNGKPKDGERKDRKDDKEEEVSGQKTHKESAGYVSGGVHKREIKGKGKGRKKGGGTGGKERWILLDRRRTQGKHGRRTGATERIGTEKWLGRQGLQKGEDTGTEGTHKESTEDAQEATHENTSYILRWKQGRQGKDGAPTG